MTLGENLQTLQKTSFIKIYEHAYAPRDHNAMVLTVHLHFGQHAKHCSVACEYLKIMHATNAACCMAPMLVAAKAAGYKPHAPCMHQIHFLGNPQNISRHNVLP